MWPRAWLWLVLCCLAAGGCSLLNKKKAATGVGPRGPAESPWGSGAQDRGPAPDRAVPASSRSGILAGQVVDLANRRLPATFIQVVSSQDSAGPRGAPIEVAADQNGYFMIQGLQPGQPYELIARAKDGDRLLAGRLWVRPPDPKVLIRISEDFAGSTTPPVPPPPGVRDPRPAAPGSGPQSSLPRDQDWAPGRGLNPDGRPPSAELSFPGSRSDAGAPARIGVPQPSPGTMPGPPRPEFGQFPPNITSIPPQASRPPAPPPAGAGNPAPPVPAANGPPPVPSCSLIGERLHHLALRDLQGEVWEYRPRPGKLVLLDFWYTTCPPCIEGIYTLRDLHARYAPDLEIVSIAYETGPLARQVENVQRVVRHRQIDYKVLLGTGRDVSCPVREQFQVTRYPTLILLDPQGNIKKRLEGLDPQKVDDLKRLIEYHLGLASR